MRKAINNRHMKNHKITLIKYKQKKKLLIKLNQKILQIIQFKIQNKR